MRPAENKTTPTQVLAGLVERVTFHNEENGFCVLRVKARGQRDLITVTGHAAMIAAGEFVQTSGIWVNDRTHGVQFRASFLKAMPPTTTEGIEKYLGSGMIRGIGPVYAKKLVRAFAEAVFEIIEQEPNRLREVTGIGPKRAERIIAGWAEQKVIREIMLFLHSNGVGTSRAVRIYKTYGADAVQLISENPYHLARDIRGIGFLTADQIAAKLGIEKTALIRVRAGISYALAEAMDDGHCGLPADELIPLAQKLLEVAPDLVETALGLELQAGTVSPMILMAGAAYFSPLSIGPNGRSPKSSRRWRAGSPPGRRSMPTRRSPGSSSAPSWRSAASQQQALRMALISKALVITGGPGVGKTTLVNSLLKILIVKNVSIALCAPTGRAAKRLSESTGIEAKTIHRLLETDPKTGSFRRNNEAPLDCDLLVSDETSMVDVPLMRAVLRALPDGAALALVGDVDQLPSVGPGQVLADIIASGAVPVVGLTEIFRQAAESRIVTNAHRINRGLMPNLVESGDFYFVDAADSEDGVRKLLAIVHERIPKRFGLDPIRDIQVLCPMNPRRSWRSLAQYRIAKGAEPAARDPRRALWLDLLSRRQGHANRERL